MPWRHRGDTLLRVEVITTEGLVQFSYNDTSRILKPGEDFKVKTFVPIEEFVTESGDTCREQLVVWTRIFNIGVFSKSNYIFDPAYN